jgi:ribonuclease VapC
VLELLLDAWAVVAWLKNQRPAAQQVRSLLEAAERGECQLFVNVINLGEIFYLSLKARDLAYGKRVLDNLRWRVKTISVSDELVMRAATLKAKHAISYADAFAAATAIAESLPLVTGDPELRLVAEQEKQLKLHWIAE